MNTSQFVNSTLSIGSLAFPVDNIREDNAQNDLRVAIRANTSVFRPAETGLLWFVSKLSTSKLVPAYV